MLFVFVWGCVSGSTCLWSFPPYHFISINSLAKCLLTAKKSMLNALFFLFKWWVITVTVQTSINTWYKLALHNRKQIWTKLYRTIDLLGIGLQYIKHLLYLQLFTFEIIWMKNYQHNEMNRRFISSAVSILYNLHTGSSFKNCFSWTLNVL